MTAENLQILSSKTPRKIRCAVIERMSEFHSPDVNSGQFWVGKFAVSNNKSLIECSTEFKNTLWQGHEKPSDPDPLEMMDVVRMHAQSSDRTPIIAFSDFRAAA